MAVDTKVVVGGGLALVIGVVVGYFIGYDHGWEKALVQHSHEEAAHESGEAMHAPHQHEQIEAPAPVPSVDLTVHKDAKSGWNAQIVLANFAFAPERVSSADAVGEGHAHIYVDGEKINRVYSEWYHLGELAPGTHEVSVRLSTNDHKELLSGGALISDSEMVLVSNNEGTMQMEMSQ